MLTTIRTVSNQKVRLQEELASMGALLGSMVQQRDVERYGVVLWVDEVHATLSDAMSEFFEFHSRFVLHMNTFFVPYVNKYESELAANNVVREENARVKQSIEEHIVALNASSNSVVAIEALLEEKLSAVRQRDMDVFELQAQLQDHERMRPHSRTRSSSCTIYWQQSSSDNGCMMNKVGGRKPICGCAGRAGANQTSVAEE